MNVGIVIQARMGSTRLPGKIVKPFFNDKGILQLIVEELCAQFDKSKIIVATSNTSLDDGVAELVTKLGVSVFRGSENDVLDRFLKAAQCKSFDSVIRICADNPFLDYDSINYLMEMGESKKADYFAFGISKSHPTIKTHFGFWPEYVNVKALQKAVTLTQDSFYREHVTNYLYMNPDIFKVELKVIGKEIIEKSNIRFTVDTIEDFVLQQNIYSTFEHLNRKRTPKELMAFVDSNPEIGQRMEKEIAKWTK